VILTIDESVPDDDIVSVSISYEGQPPLATGSAIAKGFRFDTNLDGAPAIATYCTPYLAHYWFPCKDGPTDKADSIKVDITIPQETYNGETLKGVSNGVLVNHVVVDGKETFYWVHNYPITPYYILVAV
jgi:aminopeptidase N